jgi:hypothetical protein
VTDAAWGEVVSLIALVLLIAGFTFLGRKTLWVVTADTTTYTKTTTDPETKQQESHNITLVKGRVIPDDDIVLVDADKRAQKQFSAMRLLIIGADNRTSTSKCVALAWTLAIVFGLLAILFAKWIGDDVGYQSLLDNGVREEYWLLLGGPFAAAIAAKYATTSQAQDGAKTTAPAGSANPQQLVVNDEGNADLGDFQYVAFNLVALLFYLGTFVPNLNDGLPEIPEVLTALALTSAGTYSAKKFLSQAKPTLLSMLPNSVPVGTTDKPSSIEVWGNNLIVPPSATPSGSAEPPKITVNGMLATVTAFTQTMGADHLTVQLPVGFTAGTQVKVAAVRADGVAATGPGGTDSLTLSLTA